MSSRIEEVDNAILPVLLELKNKGVPREDVIAALELILDALEEEAEDDEDAEDSSSSEVH